RTNACCVFPLQLATPPRFLEVNHDQSRRATLHQVYTHVPWYCMYGYVWVIWYQYTAAVYRPWQALFKYRPDSPPNAGRTCETPPAGLLWPIPILHVARLTRPRTSLSPCH
ncbi:unnamed protein product, partial [Laminaria digitata]